MRYDGTTWLSAQDIDRLRKELAIRRATDNEVRALLSEVVRRREETGACMQCGAGATWITRENTCDCCHASNAAMRAPERREHAAPHR